MKGSGGLQIVFLDFSKSSIANSSLKTNPMEFIVGNALEKTPMKESAGLDRDSVGFEASPPPLLFDLGSLLIASLNLRVFYL